MTALAWTAGAQAQPQGVSLRGICRTPSAKDAVWPLGSAPMAVRCLCLLALAAIIPVLIMTNHDT